MSLWCSPFKQFLWTQRSSQLESGESARFWGLFGLLETLLEIFEAKGKFGDLKSVSNSVQSSFNRTVYTPYFHGPEHAFWLSVRV